MTADPSDSEPCPDLLETRALDERVSEPGLAGHETDQRARIRAALFHGRPLAPERIGRFILLGTLGEGGMGTVLKAYDETLDRKVAVKLLHHTVARHETKRLVREAQALAKLSHPNVVQVYEVGEVEGRTFIAMEMVRGYTLRAWQGQEPRPGWRECVEVYVQAGQGLAAAHAVGLVHRDFKPGNCIIDDQGRVRVLDFGLVRELDTASADESSAASQVLQPMDDALQVSLTGTGMVLGTVAYMSPEQFGGVPTDVHSDQFSFCVALYEAVYGERPFTGDSFATVALAVTRREIRAPPKGAAVPAKLRQVLLRGLAKAPEDRWPSMEALLAELRRLSAPRGGRWLALTLGLGLTAVGVGLWQRPAVEQERCAGAEARLEGVWDATRRNEVEAAILATKRSFAAGTWRRVKARLDDYAAAWVKKHTEVCEAAGAVDGRSEEDTAKRFECLSRRRTALQEAVTVLASIDESTVVKATDVVADLPRLERCDDLEALRAALPPPEDPALAEEVEALRGQLARVESLYNAGAIEQQRAELEAIVVRAEWLGWAPLLAEAMTRSAEARAYGPFVAEDMERGYNLALEHGHDVVAAFAATQLTWIVGHRQARHEDGLRWGRTALALANRPGVEPDAKVGALLAVSAVLVALERWDEALEHSKAALELAETRLARHDPLLADTFEGLGSIAMGQGRFDEARSYHERSLSVRQAIFGLGHPAISQSLRNIAEAHVRQGRVDAALESYRSVLERAESELGPDHPNVARLLTGLASVSIQRGDLDQALAHGRRALAIQEATFGPVHEEIVDPLATISRALVAQGQLDEALEHEQRLLELVQLIWSPAHPDYPARLDAIGDILRVQGNPDGALEAYRRALELTQTNLGSKHPSVGVRLSRLGGFLREQGRLDEAVETFERASSLVDATVSPNEWRFVAEPVFAIIDIRLEQHELEEARRLAETAVGNLESSEDRPAELAWGRFLLAKALWPERSRRASARALAEQARDALEHTQEPFPPARLDELRAWLERHAAPSVRELDSPAPDR